MASYKNYLEYALVLTLLCARQVHDMLVELVMYVCDLDHFIGHMFASLF